ncbi:uncharacterized protein LOC134396010 [Elgaria multicarinata webbii]|uniref:uncharacterized protein LOC134396010 n=1 Tax=Elgaria multicarinata webbii TaxID=159646 RepID=UPI002FCCBE87
MSKTLLYCRRGVPFTVEEVHDILTHPEYEKTITDPPCKPCGGDVFLYSFKDSPQRRNDWRSDEYSWISNGVRLWPKKDPKVKKIYHKIKRAQGTRHFVRHSYTLLDGTCELVLLHYLGNEKEFQALPFGNRKENLGGMHTRSGRKVILDANPEPPQINEDFCSEPLSDSTDTPVSHPQNLEQRRNELKIERQCKRISHDDLFNVYELSQVLDGFIHEYTIIPLVLLVMGLQDVLSEINEIIQLNPDFPILFSYTETFEVGDFYLSTLLFKNVLFSESPLLPVMFMVCDSNTEDSHERLFVRLLEQCPSIDSENVVIATDGEKGIKNALDGVLPHCRRVMCWNRLRQNVKCWLKKHGTSSGKTKRYLADISNLLRSSSEQDYTSKVQSLGRKWSKAFFDYFREELHQTITVNAGSWVLKDMNIHHEKGGITANMPPSFHAALKRISGWEETSLEVIVLSLYAMQYFYWSETLHGLCNTGNLHLLPQFIKHSRSPEFTVFPRMACDPLQIMHLLQKGEFPEPRTEEKGRKSPSASRELRADFAAQNTLVTLCPQLGAFLVRGTKERSYIVHLFPKESCTCPSSRTCCHIRAARKAIGLPPVPRKRHRLQFAQLKQRKRQKLRSGRKFPRTKENVAGVPASDSVLLAVGTDLLEQENLHVVMDVGDEQPQSPLKCSEKGCTEADNEVFSRSPVTLPHNKTRLSKSHSCPSDPWYNCTFPTLVLQERGLVGSVANIYVYDYDLETLKGSNWVNDRIIDAFLASRMILAEELGHGRTVFMLSCHFMQTLMCESLSVQTMQFCMKYGVLQKDVLIIPVNDQRVHWILIVIILKTKTMLYLDSKHGLDRTIITAITSFLGHLYELDSGKPYTFEDWSFFAPTDIPRQDNSTDCGPFTCAIAHLVTSGVQLQFNQSDMAFIRPWIAREIVQYSGKTYLEKEEGYIPLEIVDATFKKQAMFQKSDIHVSRSCPPGSENTLTYCSKILPSLLEGCRSRCFMKDCCMRPSQNLTVVYCSKSCKGWYHCICLGIDSEDIPRAFVCQNCQSAFSK